MSWKKNKLPCGCEQVPLKDLLGDYICSKCGEEYWYSFCGTVSLTRTLRSILADTPLVKNLDNPDYMEIILNGSNTYNAGRTLCKD